MKVIRASHLASNSGPPAPGDTWAAEVLALSRQGHRLRLPAPEGTRYLGDDAPVLPAAERCPVSAGQLVCVLPRGHAIEGGAAPAAPGERP